MEKTTENLFKAIRRLQIHTTHLADDVLAGAYHSAFKGKGIEFEEVREYQPGDEVRSIDWNVTARMNHPFVKLFKEERELTILLVVDTSFSCRFGTKKKRKSELIAEAGALLAFSAIRNNDKVGLILFSDQVEKYLPPKKGLKHILRLIRELLFYTPKDKGTNIGAALAFAGKVHRRSSICFVLSDFISEDFSHQWELIAQKHDLVAMQVTDPYELAFPDVGLTMMEDLESGRHTLVDTSASSMQEALKRQKIDAHMSLKKLCNRTGTSLIELTTDASPLTAIKKFFKMRSRQ